MLCGGLLHSRSGDPSRPVEGVQPPPEKSLPFWFAMHLEGLHIVIATYAREAAFSRIGNDLGGVRPLVHQITHQHDLVDRRVIPWHNKQSAHGSLLPFRCSSSSEAFYREGRAALTSSAQPAPLACYAIDRPSCMLIASTMKLLPGHALSKEGSELVETAMHVTHHNGATSRPCERNVRAWRRIVAVRAIPRRQLEAAREPCRSGFSDCIQHRGGCDLRWTEKSVDSMNLN